MELNEDQKKIALYLLDRIAADKSAKIRYNDVTKYLNDKYDPYSKAFHGLLGNLSEFCHKKFGLPMLSVLLINETGLPGDGFYGVPVGLGLAKNELDAMTKYKAFDEAVRHCDWLKLREYLLGQSSAEGDSASITAEFGDWLKNEYAINGSGTASSYRKAMEMVFKYLGIGDSAKQIEIERLRKFHEKIIDKKSAEYRNFLNTFESRSYLEKGFIRSGLKSFFRYYASEPIEKDELGTDTYNLTSTVTRNDKEGRRVEVYTTKYERSSKNRNACIRIHGIKCHACGFDFFERYGVMGKDFIEVHHIKPLHSLDEEIQIDPEKDLVPLCSNCHRMVHRKKDKIVQVNELRRIIQSNGAGN